MKAPPKPLDPPLALKMEIARMWLFCYERGLHKVYREVLTDLLSEGKVVPERRRAK